VKIGTKGLTIQNANRGLRCDDQPQSSERNQAEDRRNKLHSGPESSGPGRSRESDLAQHKVEGYKNQVHAANGSGANVLGDPRIALTWIENELSQFGEGLHAGQIVTTGTCITPIPVAPGDQVRMDFGIFGSVGAQFT
jgi:hypothetical protein